MILDDIIHAADEHGEKWRKERDETTGQDERLQVNGVNMREKETYQSGGSSRGSLETTPHQKRKSRDYSDDSDADKIAEIVRRQHANSEKRYKIGCDHSALENTKAEREANRDKVVLKRATRLD